MQQEMKLLSSEYKSAAAQAKTTGSAFDQLSARQENLTKKVELGGRQVDTQKNRIQTLEGVLSKQKQTQTDLAAKVDATTKAYEKAVAEYGKNSTEAQDLKGELEKLEKQQKQNENAIDTTSKKLNTAKTDLNNVSAELADNERALENVNKEIANFKIDEATKKLDSYSAKLSSFGKEMTTKVTLPIAAAGTAAGKLSIDFETGMAKINTIAKLPQGELKNLSNGILEISDDSGVAAKDLEEGFYQALSSGVEVTGDASSALGFLDSNAKLAKAGFSDLSTTVDLTTTVINAYGKSQDEVNKISDVLIKTQDLGKTTVAELGSSMGKLIPTAKGVNVEFEQTAAGMALLTKNGIATAEATTYFNSMLNEMGKSGSKVDGILREISGKSFRELMDSGKSVGEVLSDLVGYADANNLALSDLFGSVEAGKAAMVLATNGGQDFNAMLSEMEGAAGSTDAALEKIENTTGEKLKKSFNKLMNAGIKFGDVLAPVIADVADIVSNLADSLSGMDEGTRKVVVGMLAFVAAIGPVSSGLGKMTGGLSSMIKFAGKAGKQLGLLKTGSEAVATGAVKATGGMKALIPALGGASTGAAGTALSIAGIGTAVVGMGVGLGVGMAKLYEYGVEQRRAANGTLEVVNANTELRRSSEELNQTVQSSIQTRQASIQAATNELAAAQTSIDTLFNLQNHYDGTTASQMAMTAAVDNLNAQIPGLNLSFDETTGAVSMTKDEIYKAIDAMKQQLEVGQSMTALAENERQMADAQGKYNDAVSQGASLSADLSSVMQDCINKYGDTNQARQEYLRRTEDLRTAEKENKKAIEESAGAVNALGQEHDDLMSKVTGQTVQEFQKVPQQLETEASNSIQAWLRTFEENSPTMQSVANSKGNMFGKEWNVGYENTAPEFKNAVHNSILGGMLQASGDQGMFKQSGQDLGNAQIGGFGSTGDMFSQTADIVTQNGANTVGSKENNFNQQGQRLGGGLFGGLLSKQGEVGNAGGALGQEAANRAGAIDMYGQGRAGGDSFASGLGSALQWISNIHIPAPHFVQTGSRKILGMSIPTFNVSWWSSGGIFPQRTLIGVGDRNNGSGNNAEAVIPLDQMYTRVENIFRRVTMEEQTINTPENQQQINITLPVYLNGEVIAKEMFTIVGSELAMTKRRVR